MNFDEILWKGEAWAQGGNDYILVAIQILSWILDYFPGFLPLSRR